MTPRAAELHSSSVARGKTFDSDFVLDRAIEVFWQHGYDGTSIAQLLAMMAISRQSLYDTFGDKHGLYLAALERYRAKLGEALNRVLDEHASAQARIHAMFGLVQQTVLDPADRRSCLLANAALELGQRDPRVRALVAEHLREVEDRLFRILVEGQVTGELAHDRDARAIAAFLTNALHGLGVLARGGASPASVRDAITTTLAVVSGLVRGSARAAVGLVPKRPVAQA